MLRLISAKRAEKILLKYSSWIDTVSGRYAVPAEFIRAILYKEMTDIDLMDLAADLAVSCGLLRKTDSSTGYGQIFGYVGLRAVNFAVSRGLTDYAALGLRTDHPLDEADKKDVRAVWKLLNRNPKANIEILALNLLCAADEITGNTDFSCFTEEELKLILTRYNSSIRRISPYGEEVYALAMRYRQQT